jgi:hypothetical protein
MPFDDPSSPERGTEVAHTTFRVADRPRLLGEAAGALHASLFGIEPFSLNSTEPSSFERLKSTRSSERQLSYFLRIILAVHRLSHKPSFLRAALGNADILKQ